MLAIGAYILRLSLPIYFSVNRLEACMVPVFCLRAEANAAAGWATKVKRKLAMSWAGRVD